MNVTQNLSQKFMFFHVKKSLIRCEFSRSWPGEKSGFDEVMGLHGCLQEMFDVRQRNYFLHVLLAFRMM